MALKAVIDSIDDLDEVLRNEYTEKDGKFYLSVENIDNHPQVVALKNAHERTKTEKTQLKTQLDTITAKYKDVPEEFTADEWHRLLALDGIDPNDPDARKKRKDKADEALTNLRKQYETQIANLNTKYATDIEAEKAKTEGERTLRAKDRADLELDKAMDKANIAPAFRPAVRALHRDQLKHEVGEEGDIRVFVPTNLGEVDPATFMQNWAQSDDGKIYVNLPAGPAAKGPGGGVQNTAGNPFASQSWNKTQQAALRNDMAKGERLARAAGFADFATALKATKPLEQQK